MARWIARVLWVLPVLLLGLAANQAKVAIDLKTTWEQGEPAIAEVLAFESKNRADVTYGYLNLRVGLESGQVLTQEKMSLPQVFWNHVEGRDSLAVRVLTDAAQPIVIDRLMPGHWLIAAAQVGISFLGAMLIGVGAWAWNVQLRRRRTAFNQGLASSQLAKNVTE